MKTAENSNVDFCDQAKLFITPNSADAWISQYRTIESHISASPEDAKLWADKLLLLAKLANLYVFTAKFKWASGLLFFTDRLSYMRTNLNALSEEEKKKDTIEFKDDNLDAQKKQFVEQLLEESRIALEKLVQYLPPTPGNVYAIFRLLGFFVHMDEGESSAINLQEWVSHEDDILSFHWFLDSYDRYMFAVKVLERLTNSDRESETLARVSILTDLLRTRYNFETKKHYREYNPDALYSLESAKALSSITEICALMEEWKVLITHGGKVSDKALLFSESHLETVAQLVLGDCRSVMKSADISISTAHHLLNALNSGNLLTPKVALEFETISSRCPALISDLYQWHMIMHHAYLNDSKHAEKHALMALEFAKTDALKVRALTSYWSIAKQCGDDVDAAKVILQAGSESQSLDFAISVRESVVYSLLISVIDKICKVPQNLKFGKRQNYRYLEYNWTFDKCVKDLAILNKTHLSVFEKVIDAIIWYLKALPEDSSDRDNYDQNWEDFIESMCPAVIEYYLKYSLFGLPANVVQGKINEKAVALYGYIIDNAKRFNKWPDLACICAVQRHDITSVLMLLEKCNPMAVIKHLSPRAACEFALMYARCHDVSHLRLYECMTVMQHNVQHKRADGEFAYKHDDMRDEDGNDGTPDPLFREIMYVRGIIIHKAYGDMSIFVKDLTRPEYGSKLLDDDVAVPYINQIKSSFPDGEFLNWLKVWGISVIADKVPEYREKLLQWSSELRTELLKAGVARLTENAVAAENKRIAAEANARHQVIQDLSHSVKNLVAAVVGPLDQLAQELPEQKVILEKALCGARLIREVVNAVNLSSCGSLDDFINDVEEARLHGGTTVHDIVRMALEASCDNMFDSKFFNEFSRNYFPDESSFKHVRAEWRTQKTLCLNEMLACIKRNMFDVNIELNEFEYEKISDARGSCTKLIILIQELILNAVKYVSFVKKPNRLINITLTLGAQDELLVKVCNTYNPTTRTHQTRLGQGIVQGFAKLMRGTLDIDANALYCAKFVCPNIFRSAGQVCVGDVLSREG